MDNGDDDQRPSGVLLWVGLVFLAMIIYVGCNVANYLTGP
jgi:hypothetical protein